MPNTFIICNNEEEIRSNASCWGNSEYNVYCASRVLESLGYTMTSTNW